MGRDGSVSAPTNPSATSAGCVCPVRLPLAFRSPGFGRDQSPDRVYHRRKRHPPAERALLPPPSCSSVSPSAAACRRVSRAASTTCCTAGVCRFVDCSSCCRLAGNVPGFIANAGPAAAPGGDPLAATSVGCVAEAGSVAGTGCEQFHPTCSHCPELPPHSWPPTPLALAAKVFRNYRL